MKNFRKLILGSGIALALTASFAFKAAKQTYTTVDIWDPIRTYQCDELMLAEGNCGILYHGPRCTVYYSSTYPAVPAYADSSPYCTNPVYQFN